MKYRYLSIFLLVLVLSIGAVCAQDNATDVGNVIAASSDDVISVNSNANVLSSGNSISIDDNNYNEDDFNKYNNMFKESLENDLNTSNAQTVVFEVTKLLNQSLRGKDFNLLAKYYNTLKECVDILGLVFNVRFKMRLASFGKSKN